MSGENGKHAWAWGGEEEEEEEEEEKKKCVTNTTIMTVDLPSLSSCHNNFRT